jgi:hypothetical protein
MLNPIRAHIIVSIIFSNIDSMTANDGRRFEDLGLRLNNQIHFAAISEAGVNLDFSRFSFHLEQY